MPIVRPVASECVTVSPGGAERCRASNAPAPVPASQPTRLATTVMTSDSVAATKGSAGASHPTTSTAADVPVIAPKACACEHREAE